MVDRKFTGHSCSVPAIRFATSARTNLKAAHSSAFTSSLQHCILPYSYDCLLLCTKRESKARGNVMLFGQDVIRITDRAFFMRK
jgi:hypothetical protein